MKALPECIGKEIFSYLMPNKADITWFKYKPVMRMDYYNPKYEKALLHGELCEHEGYYLSRIPKKNNKHRYYISYRMEDVLETEYFERPCNIYMYEYRSAYVGKDLEMAMLTLYYMPNNVFPRYW
jgi:hypothetical protein